MNFDPKEVRVPFILIMILFLILNNLTPDSIMDRDFKNINNIVLIIGTFFGLFLLSSIQHSSDEEEIKTLKKDLEKSERSKKKK